jgi:NAD(P)-dependent dehydrogenase (short-subunit alcohol dehydrogenase family)
MPRPTQFHNRLAGKVAIVSGAGTAPGDDGIGSSIAELFAAEGAKVAILNRDPGRAEETLRRITDAGGEAIITHAEVTDDDACRAAVAATLEAFGRVDILVNNAAYIDPKGYRLENMDVAMWDRSLAVNLKGPVLMARNVLPAMMKQKAGVILNIGSIAAVRSTNHNFAYGPAKGGMMSLSRDIAVGYGRNGVRCNTVVVGSVYTPIYIASNPVDAPGHQERRELRRLIGPMAMEGDAWDIAQPVLFLASDEARFITGVDLLVDGGVAAVTPALAPSFLQG